MLRGNVVDVAVAVVIGAAFGTVVSALVPRAARRCAFCTAAVTPEA